MNSAFPEIKKNFGFGMMRLPMMEVKESETPDVDYEQTSKMVDMFIDAGFNYFDTAHGYLETLSEVAVNKCLTSRHQRSEYLLANKLTNDYIKTAEDVRPFFEQQLEACGVDYFDFYLVHAVDKNNYPKFTECRAYEQALELKNEGLIKHLGMSYHDTAAFLDEVLTAHPEVEFVQLQVNYIDYDNDAVQSRKCLEVCAKHGKKVVVMEPVRGGSLAKLPDGAQNAFARLGDASPASYAIRFAAGCEGVYMTLSGMSNIEQMEDNLKAMTDFKPLNEDEMAAVEAAMECFRTADFIPCTACHYCTAGCPVRINIPGVFGAMNEKTMFGGWNASVYYKVATRGGGKPEDCIKCGLCESSCPQHLEIRDLLEKVAARFAKKKKPAQEA